MNEFKEGNIAVCVYDGCSIESKVSLAISYNASAVLIINNPGDGVNSGTLDQPADRIVFGLRYEIGQSILATLSSSPSFHAFASIQLIQDYTMNIIADSPSPSPPPSSSSSSFIGSFLFLLLILIYFILFYFIILLFINFVIYLFIYFILFIFFFILSLFYF